MTVLLILLAVTIVVAVYVVWLRPWLRSKPWAAGFFAAIEPIEIALWRKSETILFARLKMAVGILLTALTQLGAIDITPLMPLVPEEYRSLATIAFNSLPMALYLVGWVDQQLRKDTTKPLDVVALPAVVPASVAVALEQAEQAKAAAVEAATEAPALEAAGARMVKVE